MKSLLEMFGQANVNKRKMFGSGNPDRLVLKAQTKDDFDKVYGFRSEYARPFIYDIKNENVVFGEIAEKHIETIKSLSNNDKKKLGLEGIEHIRQLRFPNWDKFNTKEDLAKAMQFWYEENEKYLRNIAIGRIWVIPIDYDNNVEYEVYISWWNELTSRTFNKYNTDVIHAYNKKFNTNFDEYFGLDNNSNIIAMMVGSDSSLEIEIDPTTEENKQLKKIAKCIHLGTYQEKREFFAAWRAEVSANKEKELQKLGIRDGTYAKRNNMFAKHIVFDDETGKYKTVYGAKIGDSLENYVNNFVNEGSKPNTPDMITVKMPNGQEGRWGYYEDKLGVTAIPFIYITKHKRFFFGKPGQIHYSVFEDITKDERENLGIAKYEPQNIMMFDFKDTSDNFPIILGRIWILDTSKKYYVNDKGEIAKHPLQARKDKSFVKTSVTDHDIIYITWWSELSPKNFIEFNKSVVSEYNKYAHKNITDYFAFDNDGEKLIHLSENDNVVVDKRSEEAKASFNIAKCIHLATQQEKREFYAGWRAQHAKLRELELQKLGIRDGTYAKRNNMFAKTTVLDPVTGKYKVVYGAKLGDSLEDFVKNRIVE